MKKIQILSLALIAVLFSGCLGSMDKDIIGTWNMAPVNPAENTIQLNIQQDGTITVTDMVTAETDNGVWELTPNISNNRFTVSGIDPNMFETPWNAEWNVLVLDETTLIIAAKGNEFGGVWQRDFFRI